MYRTEHILKRNPNNPLITPKDIKWGHIDSVFNCGQVMFQGKTLLLLSVCPADGVPSLHVATSSDGVHFEIEPQPFEATNTPSCIEQQDYWPIDPRVTQIGDTYYISRPLCSTVGPFACLYRTRDWKTCEFVECISLPANRVPCLFPEKINGLYYRADRPANGGNNGAIWISASPDLIFWGRHRELAHAPYSNVWATDKIGPTPPIKTPDGWLMVIHGVITYAGGGRYSLGALLLDLEEPWRVIGRSKGWILTPDEPYEFMGNCQNTIFSCGAIADLSKDLLRVYYGAADTCIGLAEGKLSELLDECKHNR